MRRRFNFESFLFIFFLAFQDMPPSEVVVPDKEPVLLKKVDAIYPPYAYQEKCEGEVVVAILVKTDGSVEDVKIVKSYDEIFNEAAYKAAKQWVFKPAIFNKKPIKFWYNVRMVFLLMKTDSLNVDAQPEIVILLDSSSVIVTFQDSSSVHTTSPQNNAGEVTPRFGESQVVDESPVLIQRTESKYPPDLPDQIKGVTVFALLVDTDGRVKEMKVLRASNSKLIGPTVIVVKKWVFKPAYKGRKPVKFWYTDSLDFRIK